MFTALILSQPVHSFFTFCEEIDFARSFLSFYQLLQLVALEPYLFNQNNCRKALNALLISEISMPLKSIKRLIFDLFFYNNGKFIGLLGSVKGSFSDITYRRMFCKIVLFETKQNVLI